MATRNSFLLLSLSLSMAALAGCGNSEPSPGGSAEKGISTGTIAQKPANQAPVVKNDNRTPEQSTGTIAQKPANQAPVVKNDNRTPEQVVTIFLESLHTGNDERMKQMFTAASRGNHGLVAEKSNTKFEVFKAEFSSVNSAGGGSETVAYVPVSWITHDENSQQPRTDRFKWALRSMPEGWRISGVATLFPLLANKWVPLNFEKPWEMEATKTQILEELKEIAQRKSEQPAATVAETPSRTATSPR